MVKKKNSLVGNINKRKKAGTSRSKKNSCESNSFTSTEDAFAIQGEFYEWLDPNSLTHDIISLEYIGDKHDD